MTRHQAQVEIDKLYAENKIDQKEWSKRFDELSSNRWNAKGPVKIKQKDTKNEQLHDDR